MESHLNPGDLRSKARRASAVSLVAPLLSAAALEAGELVFGRLGNPSSASGAAPDPGPELGEPVCGASALTQSTDPTTIVFGNSVVCLSPSPGSIHFENSSWRRFVSDELPDGFSVCSIDVGIEDADAAGVGTSQPLDVRVYRAPAGAFPGVTLTLVGEASIDVGDQTQTHLEVPVNALVPAGDQLIVEVRAPDGTVAGHSLVLGSNEGGQSAPSYISAPNCDVNVPTSLASLGFPTVHWVQTVRGDHCPVTCGEQTRTRSLDPCTVDLNNSVACTDGGSASPSSYWRHFPTAGLPPGDFELCSVRFGIESAVSGTGGTQPVTLRLWHSAPGAFPASTGTLLKQFDLAVPDQSLSLFAVAVEAGTVLPAGRDLVVEVFAPGGAGRELIFGANDNGQSAPSYVTAPHCSIPVPTALSSLGYPTVHFLTSVGGRSNFLFASKFENFGACEWSVAVGAAPC